jgi:hypothetical protein
MKLFYGFSFPKTSEIEAGAIMCSSRAFIERFMLLNEDGRY